MAAGTAGAGRMSPDGKDPDSRKTPDRGGNTRKISTSSRVRRASTRDRRPNQFLNGFSLTTDRKQPGAPGTSQASPPGSCSVASSPGSPEWLPSSPPSVRRPTLERKRWSQQLDEDTLASLPGELDEDDGEARALLTEGTQEDTQPPGVSQDHTQPPGVTQVEGRGENLSKVRRDLLTATEFDLLPRQCKKQYIAESIIHVVKVVAPSRPGHILGKLLRKSNRSLLSKIGDEDELRRTISSLSSDEEGEDTEDSDSDVCGGQAEAVGGGSELSIPYYQEEEGDTVEEREARLLRHLNLVVARYRDVSAKTAGRHNLSVSVDSTSAEVAGQMGAGQATLGGGEGGGSSSSSRSRGPGSASDLFVSRGAGGQEQEEAVGGEGVGSVRSVEQEEQEGEQGDQQVEEGADGGAMARTSARLGVSAGAVVGGAEVDVSLEEGEEDNRSYLELDGWLDPVIPPEGSQFQETGSGFNSIIEIGGWKAALVRFGMLEKVPYQFEEQFAAALQVVMETVIDAEDGSETHTAGLLWMLFLPQALLRKSYRGGKRGRNEIAKRFEALLNNNWGALVKWFQADYARIDRPRARNNKKESPEQTEERVVRQALSLIAEGHVSKATRRLRSDGIASMDDVVVRQEMRNKFPARKRDLPRRVVKEEAVRDLADLRNALLDIDTATSAGSGGFQTSYLECLGRNLSKEGMDALQKLGMLYLHADLPPWYVKLWITIQTAPLVKPGGGIRPLGLRNPLVKTFHKQAVTESKPALRDFLEPVQLAMSEGGAGLLVFAVRESLEINPEFELVIVDLKNAFNEVIRAATINAFEAESTLRHLATLFGMVLAPHIALEARGVVWGETGEGQVQGDPLSGAGFAVTIQKHVVALDETLKSLGGFAMAGADDISAVGPRGTVVEAVIEFARAVWEDCGLRIQWNKTKYYCLTGDVPGDAPADLKLAGRLVDGVFRRGFLVWGIPVGEDAFVEDVLMEKVMLIVEDAKKCLGRLGAHRQAAWAAYKWCVQAQFDYFASLCYPSNSVPVAEALDKELFKLLEEVCGTKIPSNYNAETNHDFKITVGGEGGLRVPLAQLLVRQPVKQGGMGLRSQKSLCLPAFLGAVERSIPRMADGFSDILGEKFGGREVFGPDASPMTRWQQTLDSDTRLGREFRLAWEELVREAQWTATYLDQEIEGPLGGTIESLGQGSTDGATRGKIWEVKERNMAKTISKRLEEFVDRDARPVWALMQTDKLSTAWLLVLPGADSTLSAAEFTQCVQNMLFIPSKAVEHVVGLTVGNRKIDEYGDILTSAVMVGDGWRKRHDTMKNRMARMLKWANITHDIEVFGMFARYITQEGLSRMEEGRKRQGIVPDFKIAEPPTHGKSHTEEILAEMKCINSCKSRYRTGRRNAEERAVSRRAATLQQEYLSKAKEVDHLYCGVERGTVGQVEAKMREYKLRGFVFGAFGEASEDVHTFVKYVADARMVYARTLVSKWRANRISDEAETAINTGLIRRQLSLETVRSHARLVIERAGVVGAGSGVNLAVKRRAWAAQEERRMQSDRRAQQICAAQGRPIIRRGRFMNN